MKSEKKTGPLHSSPFILHTSTVAIIGAGPIGLELAVAFKQFGIDYVQIDAGQIGSTIEWYPIEMLFHSSSDRLGLAGVPIQTATQQKITREEYLAYLRSIVLQVGLEIRSYERISNPNCSTIERR